MHVNVDLDLGFIYMRQLSITSRQVQFVDPKYSSRKIRSYLKLDRILMQAAYFGLLIRNYTFGYTFHKNGAR